MPQDSTPKRRITIPASIDSSFGLPSDSQGRWSLHYFRHQASREISSLLSVNFWTSYVLPMSVSCKSVQHAIVALATQHRAWAESRAAPGRNSSTDSTYSFQSYGKAIRSLNEQIGKQKKRTSLVEETLITCLLLICFNVLQGNDVDTLMHLEAGLQICNKNLPRPQRPSLQFEDPHQPIQELAMSFKRLDLQAAWYVGSYQIKSLTPTDPQGVELPPLYNEHLKDFVSMVDARQTLDNIVCLGFHFMRSEANQVKYLRRAEGHHDLHYNNLTCRRDLYIKQLRQWDKLFRRLQLVSLRQEDDIHRINASKHKISYNVNLISLSICLSPDEITYDRFQSEFIDIIKHAEKVLQSPGPNYRKEHGYQNNMLFGLEMSIVQPLYFTALKCRETSTRHRSLALLRKCGKEGVWDADVMARVAQYVVTLEESQRRLDPLTERFEISENNRICGTAINLMRSERKVWVQCSTRNWSSEGVKTRSETYSTDEGYVWEFFEQTIYL